LDRRGHNMTNAEVLKRLERCFDNGEVETVVNFVPGSGLAVGPGSAEVKVIHRPSGLEATGKEFTSQVANKASALLRLLQKLHESAATTP